MKSKSYEEFVEKFKPKKTTDDCFTPPIVYDVVKDWACEEYNINPETIVRPFWPGGDYMNFDYPEGCVVLDNPPFSILAKICEFYIDKEIPFFLFAPTLTALSAKKVCMKTNHIICDANVEYENGAAVNTSFITSYGGDIVIQTAPKLSEALNNAVETLRKEKRRLLPKYDYPDHVLTAAQMGRYGRYGIDFKVCRKDCIQISKLDAQRDKGKSIFGCGLLLSNKAAAERVAAERVAAEREQVNRWELSKREWDVIETLG